MNLSHAPWRTRCIGSRTGHSSKPDQGKIYFKGEDTTGLSPHEMALRGLGRTFQIVKPFPSLTVLENVIIALGLKQYPKLRRLWRRWGSPEIKEAASYRLEQVGLKDFANRRAGALPLGSLRKLDLDGATSLFPRIWV